MEASQSLFSNPEYKLHFSDQTPGWETPNQHQNIKEGTSSRASLQGHLEIALCTRFECFLCDHWTSAMNNFQSFILIHWRSGGLIWSSSPSNTSALAADVLVTSNEIPVWFWMSLYSCCHWHCCDRITPIIKPIIKKPRAWLIYRLHALRICHERLAA